MKYEFTLEYPVHYNGEEFQELTIRRPKIRDMKKFDKIKDGMSKSITMLADLADVPLGVIEELDTADFNAASKVIVDFLGVSVAEIQQISDQ